MKSARGVLVARCPGEPVVVAAVHPACRDGDVHALGICRVEQDGVQAQTTGARIPLAALRVVVQALHQRPALAAVGGLEQGSRLHAGIKHARLAGASGGDVPHLDQRLGCLGEGSPGEGFFHRAGRSAGFGRARQRRVDVCLRPGLAQVVGVVRGRAINEMIHRSVQAPIARVVGHVHQVPAFEQRAFDRPLRALSVAGEDEAAFACAHHDEYFGCRAHFCSPY